MFRVHFCCRFNMGNSQSHSTSSNSPKNNKTNSDNTGDDNEFKNVAKKHREMKQVTFY